MINLSINSDNIEAELRGSDEQIVEELSVGTIRLLQAMENSDGNSVQENLASLILQLIARTTGRA